MSEIKENIIIKLGMIGADNPHYTPFMRQSPGRLGIWDNCHFYFHPPNETCDFFVAWDGISSKQEITCPQGNTLLITGEPPNIRRYNPDFVGQFSRVITCQKAIRHKRTILTQQCMPWWVGLDLKNKDSDGALLVKMDYDALKNTQPEKMGIISVIVSNKAHTPGHRRRLKFVTELKKELGDMLTVYGSDNYIPDKWDGIAPFKYHIAIENTSIPNYWTEKLADSYLAGAYPFYFGCTNLDDYFPSNSFTAIDITDPEEAIDIIIRGIKQNRYERSIDSLNEAKRLVMDEYNIFPFIADIANRSMAYSRSEKLTFLPEQHADWGPRTRLKYRWGQLLNIISPRDEINNTG